MMRAVALVGGFLAIAAPARAQAPHDVVIRDLHLGGDSAQATAVQLTAHQVYVVEVTPARAQIRLHLRAATPQPFLSPITLADRQPPDAGAVFGLAQVRAGEYIVELTNPDVGATHVRIILVTTEQERASAPPGGVDAAADETPTTVLDETFPGPAASVQLAGETVYRVEISPASVSAQVFIRSVRSRSGPPMVMYPTDEGAIGAAGTTFVIIPTNTDEYRVDVIVNGGEPARVRIIHDPKESARWLRVAEQTRNVPPAGVSVRAIAIGAFPSPDDSMTAGVGFDACFAAVPRGSWLSGPVGGCVFQIAYFTRRNENGTLVVSIAPRWVLSRPEAATQISLMISTGLGTTTQGSKNQTYWLLGFGLIAEHAIIGRHWLVEAEGGFTAVNIVDNPTPRPPSAFVPRAALGIQFRP